MLTRDVDVRVIRNVTRWIVMALLTAVLVSGPVATPPAEAATKATLTIKTEKLVFKTACGKVTVKLKTPVLKGSTKANRKRVADWAKWLKKDVKKTLASNRNRCDGIKVDAGSAVKGTVYKGRYLSVRMSWGGTIEAESDRFLNLDLKTGKKAPLSKFASNTAGVLDLAVCLAATDTYGYEAWEREHWCEDRRQVTEGWLVSGEGIWLHHQYLGGVQVPWAYIVKPSYSKQKKHVSKNVEIHFKEEVVREKATVTVQGNLVTVRDPYIGDVYYGAKGWGDQTENGWRVFVFPKGGQIPGYINMVKFVSKSNDRAKYYWLR